MDHIAILLTDSSVIVCHNHKTFLVMRFFNYLIYDFNFFLKEKIVLASVVFFTLIVQAVCAQIGGAISGVLLAVTCPLLILFVIFGTMYLASHFGIAFRKKQTSILFLSFPVSVTEKFFVRFINQIIVPWLIVLLSACMAYIVLYLVNFIYPLNVISALSFFNANDVTDVYAVELFYRLLSVTTSSFFFQLTVMMLGSLVFSKYAIIKTFIAYTIISWVMTPMFYDQKSLLARAESMKIAHPTTQDVHDFVFSFVTEDLIVLYVVLSVIIMAISYVLFRRKTIIKTGY